jgi:hypothetical protein
MSNRNGSHVWLAAWPLALVATAFSPAGVSAGPTPHMRSGLVGIARLQTARLSAVLVVTLEVFETLTGRTTVFLSHPDFIDNPNLTPSPTTVAP